MTTEDLQQIQSIVQGAKKVLIFTHKNPNHDVMASVLALKLAMEKMGKDVTAVIEGGAPFQYSHLTGASSVKNNLTGGKNLVLTYAPYNLGDIEKVSYIEDEGLNASFKLTLIPREGLYLDPKNFSFSNSGGGATADLVFTVDVVQPTDLGSLYDSNLFANSTINIINIDNHDENKDYGKFNLVEPQAATVSEITTFFLRAINSQMDNDISNNLYQGLLAGSDHFQSPKVTAATFEAAAICLRSGAKAATNVSMPPKRQETEVGPQNQPIIETQSPAAPVNGNQSLNPQDNWTAPKVYRGTSTV